MRKSLVILFAGLCIGCVAGFKIGYDFHKSENNQAKCESMGGVYGVGKYFVNGFEVDNQ